MTIAAAVRLRTARWRQQALAQTLLLCGKHGSFVRNRFTRQIHYVFGRALTRETQPYTVLSSLLSEQEAFLRRSPLNPIVLLPLCAVQPTQDNISTMLSSVRPPGSTRLLR